MTTYSVNGRDSDSFTRTWRIIISRNRIVHSHVKRSLAVDFRNTRITSTICYRRNLFNWIFLLTVAFRFERISMYDVYSQVSEVIYYKICSITINTDIRRKKRNPRLIKQTNAHPDTRVQRIFYYETMIWQCEFNKQQRVLKTKEKKTKRKRLRVLICVFWRMRNMI